MVILQDGCPSTGQESARELTSCAVSREACGTHCSTDGPRVFSSKEEASVLATYGKAIHDASEILLKEESRRTWAAAPEPRASRDLQPALLGSKNLGFPVPSPVLGFSSDA